MAAALALLADQVPHHVHQVGLVDVLVAFHQQSAQSLEVFENLLLIQGKAVPVRAGGSQEGDRVELELVDALVLHKADQLGR